MCKQKCRYVWIENPKGYSSRIVNHYLSHRFSCLLILNIIYIQLTATNITYIMLVRVKLDSNSLSKVSCSRFVNDWPVKFLSSHQ